MNLKTNFASKKMSRPNSSQPIFYWNILAALILFTGIFFLMTNGIPLKQLGLLDFEVTKKICVRFSRITILVTFLSFRLWALKWPSIFFQLGIVKWVKQLSDRSLKVSALSLYFLYVAIMTMVGFMRHGALETRAFDLGIFAQALWNTLQGDFLYSSIKDGICLLGDHVSPILIFLTPFYAIWSDPRSLILVQAIFTGSTLLVVTFLAREKLHSTLIALIFAVIYFFYLPPRSALHEDFHPELLAGPFLLLAFIFLEKGKIILFLLSLFIAVLTKENMYGVAFIFGFHILVWKPRHRILGVLLMGISVLLFFFAIRWVVPHFGGRYLYEGFYTHLAANPVESLKMLFSGESLEYIFKVFFPFLFLPFFHLPTFILTAPVLLQNLFSNNPVMRSFSYHYSSGLTAFLFISTIYGFKSLIEKFPWLKGRSIFFAGILLFVALLRSGPSEYFYFYDSFSHKTQRRDHIRQKLAQIPAEVSILSHNNFIPQIINRKKIYQFDYRGRPTKAESAKELNVDYVILDREFMEPGTLDISSSVAELTAVGYAVEYSRDGFYILKKSSNP